MPLISKAALRRCLVLALALALLAPAGLIAPLAPAARAEESELQKLIAERDDNLRQAYEEYAGQMAAAREERARHKDRSGDAVEAQYKYLELRAQARKQYRAAVRAIMEEYRSKAVELGGKGTEPAPARNLID